MLKADTLALQESQVETTLRIILTVPLLTKIFYIPNVSIVEFYQILHNVSIIHMEFFQNWSGQNRSSRIASAGPVTDLHNQCQLKLVSLTRMQLFYIGVRTLVYFVN